MEGFVYIIRLSAPLGNDNHRAQFYCGFAHNLMGRFWHHCNGSGAAFTRAAAERGIGMEIIWSSPGTRALERQIKRGKNMKRFLKSRGVAV